MNPEDETAAPTDDWGLFDEMYDEEHSVYLFKYWMQKHGSNWQSEMVAYYLTILSDLEEDRLTSDDLLAQRRQQVARVFKQSGLYDVALQLVQKTIDIERRKLGEERPEDLASLYYLAADICREKLNTVTFVRDVKKSLLQEQLKYARSALELREDMEGDENKFEKGQILRLLSIALRNWSVHGGDDSLSAEDARTEASKCIDEAIEIFKQLNAKGNMAKAIANKANLQPRGSEEKEKLFREAIGLCEEAYGKFNVSSGHLHRNMYILYHDRKDYDEAYQWLLKCKEIREKVYGKYHPQTQQVYEALEKDPSLKSRKTKAR